jgi:hypothetical protein
VPGPGSHSMVSPVMRSFGLPIDPVPRRRHSSALAVAVSRQDQAPPTAAAIRFAGFPRTAGQLLLPRLPRTAGRLLMAAGRTCHPASDSSIGSRLLSFFFFERRRAFRRDRISFFRGRPGRSVGDAVPRYRRNLGFSSVYRRSCWHLPDLGAECRLAPVTVHEETQTWTALAPAIFVRGQA